MASPHLFPKHVPNKLVLSEIVYQTVLQGFNYVLVKDVKKELFIPYNFYIGHYKIPNSNHAKQEGKLMLEFKFPQGKFKNHDPQGLVEKHCSYISWYWPYPHEGWDDELMYQDISSMNEVEERLKDREDFIFKYLSLEEKQAKLEKKLEVAKQKKAQEKE